MCSCGECSGRKVELSGSGRRDWIFDGAFRSGIGATRRDERADTPSGDRGGMLQWNRYFTPDVFQAGETVRGSGADLDLWEK